MADKSDLILRQYKEENEKLKQANASLRRVAGQWLGSGYWGLNPEENRKFSHEEIIFLFSKVHTYLGFESILLIQQEYPDCLVLKQGQKKYIEFEPKLSDFDHTNDDDLSKCNYIVCWEDDLDESKLLKKRIKEAGIEIVELKKHWELTKVSKYTKHFEWNRRDFELMRPGKISILSAFIKSGKEFLTHEEVQEYSGKKGKSYGGAKKGFFEQEQREWLIRDVKDGLRVNRKYWDIIKEVLTGREMLD